MGPPEITDPVEAGEPPAGPAPLAAGRCPSCGEPYEELQEYCLECGARLPVARGFAGRFEAAWRRRLGWYPGARVWLVLGLLVLAAVGAAAAVLATREGAEESAPRTIVATTSPPPVRDAAAGAGTTATQTETAPVATVPNRQPPKPARLPGRDGAGPGSLVEWPAGRDGYTIVLLSLPDTGSRREAEEKARRALQAGLQDVGVLDSSRYASLHPGFYVVFTGVYASFAEAQGALSDAHAAGYEHAYAREITS